MLNTPDDDSLLYHMFLPFLFILSCTLIPRQFLKNRSASGYKKVGPFIPSVRACIYIFCLTVCMSHVFLLECSVPGCLHLYVVLPYIMSIFVVTSH